MQNVIERVLVTREEIEKRCDELGKEISEAYKQDKEAPLLVALLSELIKHIDLDIQFDFMNVSSYQGTQSVGDVKILKDLDISIKDRRILLVEDIVDTGRTLKKVTQLLMNKGAADVKVVALLDKPERRVVDIEADYIGFTIPDEFVVGFGLDYNEHYRCFPYVGVLKKEVYK